MSQFNENFVGKSSTIGMNQCTDHQLDRISHNTRSERVRFEWSGGDREVHRMAGLRSTKIVK